LGLRSSVAPSAIKGSVAALPNQQPVPDANATIVVVATKIMHAKKSGWNRARVRHRTLHRAKAALNRPIVWIETSSVRKDGQADHMRLDLPDSLPGAET
jgi:hypothetical protein